MSVEPSTPRTAEPAVARGDMRRRLLDAALTVLQRDGAAGLTVRAITSEAGCSTTGVYTWFGGKHGVVEAIYLEGFESFERAVAAPLAAGDLVAGGRAYRGWALANPTHYLIMFGSAVPDFEPGREALVRAGESFQMLVDAVAHTGAEDPVATAYHLYATLHGYVMLELVHVGPADARTLETLFEGGLVRAAAAIGRASAP